MSAALLNQDFGSESEGEEFNPAPADDSDNEAGSGAGDQAPPRLNGRKSSVELKGEDEEDAKEDVVGEGEDEEADDEDAEEEEDEEDAISVRLQQYEMCISLTA